jgi:putative NADPH-quinone reductase
MSIAKKHVEDMVKHMVDGNTEAATASLNEAIMEKSKQHLAESGFKPSEELKKSKEEKDKEQKDAVMKAVGQQGDN